MPSKINLGIHTDQITNTYEGDSKNTVESFDTKKDIDQQLGSLQERSEAKEDLQKDLAEIKTASNLKDFLEETDTEKGYNKYVTTYATHISIKIGKREYAFKADKEETRVAIHTAIVDFFRTQVIQKQIDAYKESDDYKNLKEEKQSEELEEKIKEIEDEFGEDNFEIDSNTLKTKLSQTGEETSEASTDTKEDKKKGWKSKIKSFFKNMFGNVNAYVKEKGGWVKSRLLTKISAGVIGLAGGATGAGSYILEAAQFMGGTVGNYVSSIMDPKTQQDILAANETIKQQEEAAKQARLQEQETTGNA